MNFNRYHIILDLKNVPHERLIDTDGLQRFLVDLPGKINMNILHGPVVIEGLPINPGLTGFVIIDFSHISVHTFTANDTVLVDIFSCKKYSQEDAKQFVLAYFQVPQSDANIKEVWWS